MKFLVQRRQSREVTIIKSESGEDQIRVVDLISIIVVDVFPMFRLAIYFY